MFRKIAKVKGCNQLRNCEKKSLRDVLLQSYPMLTANDIYEIIPKRGDISLLKVETAYKGVIQVYTVNKLPTLFIYAYKTLPTVYLLWRFPQLLIPFTTHVGVLPKLTDGADLMLPGVVYPNFKSRKPVLEIPDLTPVYINLTTNSAAVAVGMTIMHSDAMYSSNTGRCVEIFHVYGDLLCTVNNITIAPMAELGLVEYREEVQAPPTITPDLEISYLISDSSEFSEEDLCSPKTEKVQVEDIVNLDTNDDENVNFENIPDMKDTDADDLLMHCFFACIKYKTGIIELPILISKFYKNHILEKCPSNLFLDIKKTSYKKLTRFLDCMVELGVIVVKPLKTGIYHITEIHYDHPCVTDFTLDPMYGPPKEKPQIAGKPQLSIVESHSVTASVVPIFSKFGYSKGDIIDNTEIRNLVTEFVKTSKLQNANDKNLVNATPALKAIFGINPFMSWKDLFSKVYDSMTGCYKITYGEKVFVRRGKLPTIDITIGKRSGNKKVTLVDNIEVYGIDIDEMSTYCQRNVAASSTINKSQTAKKGDQLQVQGNQVLFIFNTLTEHYNIPKRYIKGLELAPKQKK